MEPAAPRPVKRPHSDIQNDEASSIIHHPSSTPSTTTAHPKVDPPPSFPPDFPPAPSPALEGVKDISEFIQDATPTQTYPSASGDAYNELPTYPSRPHFNIHHLAMRPATQCVIFDGCPNDPYHPSSMPLYQTSTFVQPSSAEYGPYDYTRSGNPTRTALETLVAGLEDAYAAFFFTSGMAALNVVTRLVKSGEEIIASADLYGGMHRLLTQVCVKSGIHIKFIRTDILSEVETAISSNTRLIHLESPSNPLMRITDIHAICRLASKHSIYVSVDSTMMSPHLMKPLALGADIVIHSATKFLCGHSDTMAGVVCVKNEKLSRDIAFHQNAEGTALAPFDCWLLLRSIKTMALRVERAQENAFKVATFLSRHPAVLKLYYAGDLPNPLGKLMIPWEKNHYNIGMNAEHGDITVPGARVKRVNIALSKESLSLHQRQARGGGSVLSFETGDIKYSQRVVDACRLFKITVSFGSCNSLIEMPCTLSHASIPAEKRTLPADLIRLSIGIEDVEDILQDLERSFKVAASSVMNVRQVYQSFQQLVDVHIPDIKQSGCGEEKDE